VTRPHLIGSAAAIGTGLAVALVLPVIANDYWLGVATTLAMWIALTESWVLLSGMTGYISLGQAVFVGVGAYVMSLTWQQVPIWLGLCAGGAAAAVLALIVGTPCLRVRGPYFVILTLGVAEFGKYVVINIEASLANFGRLLLDAPDTTVIFRVMLLVALVAYMLAFGVRRSRFGFGLRAIREDENAAEMTGVPVTKLKIIAFVISAIIPGVVGALMVMRSGYFEPLQAFDPLISLTTIAMAMIGGIDDAPGPMLGALFLVALSELLWNSMPQVYMIVLGLLLVVFVMRVPEGVYGRVGRLMARWST
jgi:branched-chain amino acid transport system permease protein